MCHGKGLSSPVALARVQVPATLQQLPHACLAGVTPQQGPMCSPQLDPHAAHIHQRADTGGHMYPLNALLRQLHWERVQRQQAALQEHAHHDHAAAAASGHPGMQHCIQ
jgi:hypothetical protein